MELWVPGAEVVHGPHQSGSGPMVGGPSRATWHRTVGNGYAGNKAVLVHEGFEPHLLWDPWTGQLGQFIAADRGAFALKHVGAPQTNREGRINFQIEVADHGLKTHVTDTPMVNGAVIVAFLRQLGVVDELPAGAFPDPGHAGRRDAATWTGKGGHYGHVNVPGNDHTDPYFMDMAKLWALHPAHATVPPVPVYAPPFPLSHADYYGRTSADPHCHSGLHWAQDRPGLAVWQTQLRHRGWRLGNSGVFDGTTWSVVTAFQRKLGLPVTGRVDVRTWAAAWVLRVVPA